MIWVSEIPRQLYNTLRSNIVKAMLLGDPRDSVAKNQHTSAGSVSKVWKEFEGNVTKVGIENAAKQYDVETTAEGLRTLGKELSKPRLTVDKSLAGTRILTLLDSLGVDRGRAESFLKAFFNHSQEAGGEPKALVEYALKLRDLERTIGETYFSLIQKFETTTKQVSQREGQLRTLGT